MLIKQESITSQKLCSGDFGCIANSVLNKGKPAIPLLFKSKSAIPLLSSVSDKAKMFAKNFSKNSNLDGSGISLSVFLFRTNLKLQNISVTHKWSLQK